MQFVKYLGISYKLKGNGDDGLDCITLCQKLGKDRGVEVGDINYEINSIIQDVFLYNMTNESKYIKVEAQADCLVVFKVMGLVQHVGYMINDKEFVHIMKDRNVTKESINSPIWRKRVVGFYKYVG